MNEMHWLWKAYPLVYDLGVLSLAPYAELQRDLLGFVRSRLARRRDGAQHLEVVDCCCGTGNLAASLLRLDPRIYLTGIDFASAMLHRAACKSRQSKRARWLIGDAATVLAGLPSASADVAVICNALYAQLDRIALLESIRRVLRADGQLLISDPQADSQVFDLLAAHFRRVGPAGLYALPLLLPSGVFSWLIERQRRFRFTDRDQVITELSQVGFDVTHRAVTYGGANYLLVADVRS